MFLKYSQYHHINLLMLIICSFMWQSCAYNLLSLARNVEGINPNIRCPGKNEENIWLPCKHGGYIENSDPKNCGDRYVCYATVNEPCHSGKKCADNAICTACGICQKCDSAEHCSHFDLCPNYFGFKNYLKRVWQERSNKLNME